jgi:hypothetical protein
MNARILGKLALIGAVSMMWGCSKLTYERWQTIQEGESPEAVRATLGEPLEKLDMRWMYMNADRGIVADIYFDEGRVIGKTWSDPERGHQGKSPHVREIGDAEEFRYRRVE